MASETRRARRPRRERWSQDELATRHLNSSSVSLTPVARTAGGAVLTSTCSTGRTAHRWVHAYWLYTSRSLPRFKQIRVVFVAVGSPARLDARCSWGAVALVAITRTCRGPPAVTTCGVVGTGRNVDQTPGSTSPFHNRRTADPVWRTSRHVNDRANAAASPIVLPPARRKSRRRSRRNPRKKRSLVSYQNASWNRPRSACAAQPNASVIAWRYKCAGTSNKRCDPTSISSARMTA
jgi:hypothetical protein